MTLYQHVTYRLLLLRWTCPWMRQVGRGSELQAALKNAVRRREHLERVAAKGASITAVDRHPS